MHIGFGWGNQKEKRPPERPRHRWEGNIKMHLREIGWDSMHSIDLAQDKNQWWALVNKVMDLRAP
jgi:hypothetical protein